MPVGALFAPLLRWLLFPCPPLLFRSQHQTPLSFIRDLYCPVSNSGNIGALSWVDRLLGRLTAYLRGDFGEDVNDHSTAEYIRLFKTMVNNAKKPFVLKAGELAVETAQQVTGLLDIVPLVSRCLGLTFLGENIGTCSWFRPSWY